MCFERVLDVTTLILIDSFIVRAGYTGKYFESVFNIIINCIFPQIFSYHKIPKITFDFGNCIEKLSSGLKFLPFPEHDVLL